MLNKCRGRQRELLFAGCLLAFTIGAIATGIYFGRPGWRVDDRALETLIENAEEAFIAEGPGKLASSDTTQIASNDDIFFLVEDSVTGQAIKRNRQARGSDFKRWTRYKVLDSYEMAGRLVAGLKESKSIVIRIQPKGVQVPTAEQLQEIAETLRSREHHSTYVYFFLPGMELKQNPWSTVFQQSNRPTSVSFDKTNVPELYARFEEQVWKSAQR
jgi:hypothetical protein